MTLQLASPAFRGAIHAAALAALLAAAVPAFSAPSPADGSSPEATSSGIRPLVGALLTGTVGTNQTLVTNPDGSTATGSLSGRYEAFAGAEFPIDPDGLRLRLTAGIHTSAGFASVGGGEHFTRLPLEATLWYPLGDKLRIGGGAGYDMRARFSGAGRSTSNGLNATPSLIFATDYALLAHLRLDLRYVYERWEQYGGDDVEGSHWGIGLTAIY